MDKKKKMKLMSAACFVILCGAAYLGIRGMGQDREQIVLEKGPQATEAPVETTAGPMTDTPDKQVYVHVCGAVVNEGVYALPAGSRVADGIAAAGGFSDAADTVYHNLAALLSDGLRVYVPTVEETKDLSVPERTLTVGDTGGIGTLTDEKETGKVNLNTAGLEELMTLSGIGEAKAQSIIQYREKVGPFQSIEEIKNVSGIGDAMFERVRESIIAE